MNDAIDQAAAMPSRIKKADAIALIVDGTAGARLTDSAIRSS